MLHLTAVNGSYSQRWTGKPTHRKGNTRKPSKCSAAALRPRMTGALLLQLDVWQSKGFILEITRQG